MSQAFIKDARTVSTSFGGPRNRPYIKSKLNEAKFRNSNAEGLRPQSQL